VSTLDIYPTIADLLRLGPPAGLCGSSLAPVLLASDPPPRGPTFHQFYLPERALRDNEDGLLKVAVRNDEYNLVFNCREGSYELYDWRADYYEMNDLARSTEHRDTFDVLQETLLSFVQAARPGRVGSTGTPAPQGREKRR
jgi:arylsulfatase A-like enzyme